MSDAWSYRKWNPRGERVRLGDVTFDSAIDGGAGQNFQLLGSDRVRFRARAGLEPYSWRFCFCIESPGDRRVITLEAADFNHFGQELWQEQAAVVSRDGETWTDLGTENMTIVPWTPTGRKDEDDSIDDGSHPPYGVRYRVRLDAKKIWLASPTPYSLRHCATHLPALAERCAFFTSKDIGRAHHSEEHGFPLSMVRAAKPGGTEDKLRVVVLAGEHPSETAGMYACEGLMEEILRTTDLLSDFSFWIVPVVNVDGVAFGRTYHNVDPKEPASPGVNLARDWGDRTQPETQATWQAIESLRPHCVISLHNGRHRREFEVCAPPQPHLATLLRHLREHLPLPIEHWRPYNAGAIPGVAILSGVAETALCFETLLLQKLPQCETFRDSYRRTGALLLRGLVHGLREISDRPQMRARSEALGTRPLRCRAKDFTAKLPWFYYDASFQAAQDHHTFNVEINGLPLVPGHYDAWLRLAPKVKTLDIRRNGGDWATRRADDGWLLLSSLPVPARKLTFEFEYRKCGLPIDEILIAPEATPRSAAERQAQPYDRYERNTHADEKAHLKDWGKFRARLMGPGAGAFGATDLKVMLRQITDWAAERQVLEESDPHCGAVHSEEDKYDARDTAAAAACFAERHGMTDDKAWLDRALAARRYVYRGQMHEPGNAAHDGGFVHMVQGMWGVNFTRLEPPYPGIDGVDTCAVIHLLCRAVALGLPFEEEDRRIVMDAARWVASNEPLPGVFLHHEGATHDCQNSNALGLSALVRAYHALAEADADPPAEWLDAVERGVAHYLEGQEAIGVWPYLFASVGRRGQAFHFENIPDHGIGLYHLTRVLDRKPLADREDLVDALKRAARWYLGVSRLDGDTIDLEYDERPDLGSDICFSGFTWCRFTAAATLLRIARLTDETEPWRSLALRLMEHVWKKRWQADDPERAPVVAHARPDAKLATWCQAAEWDAVMLSEILEDLEGLESE